MTLSSIMNTAVSGLNAAQTQLKVTSDNISNVSTTGYVRKVADQQALNVNGAGAGVEVTDIRLATDKYLQQSSLTATAASGAADVRSELYDSIQTLFGDPSGDTGLFSSISGAFAAFTTAAETATSTPLRDDALSQVSDVLSQAASISDGVQAVRADADSQLASAVQTVTSLLANIESLNKQITAAKATGGDSSGAETVQSQLIDQVSQYMDVKVSSRAAGGVTLRTGDGLLLAGDGSATLSYTAQGSVNAQTQFSDITITEPGGQPQALAPHLQSGQMAGLLQVRDVDGPQATERLAELVSKIADQVNAAHNASSAVPAPSALTGQGTNLDIGSALTGFTGKTTVAVLDSSGVVQHTVSIDFDAKTMTADGGTAVSWTAASFTSTLNAQLGSSGSAAYSSTGALSLSAASGYGVAVVDDSTSPSAKGGRGFSDYFGLNDLIVSGQNTNYDTGLSGSDTAGFSGPITLHLTDAKGAALKDVTVNLSSSQTVDQVKAALNTAVSGVGAYSLDANGALTFTASNGGGVSVASDQTSHAGGDLTVSSFFGIGPSVRAARADSFAVRSDIAADSSKLALAQVDLGAASGQPALSSGDGDGALAISQSLSASTRFQAAGGASASTTSIANYMAGLSGAIGQIAAATDSDKTAAAAVSDAATSRRSASEGVNLDEELVNLTTYQQSYSASARLVTAVKDMWDVLLNM